MPNIKDAKNIPKAEIKMEQSSELNSEKSFEQKDQQSSEKRRPGRNSDGSAHIKTNNPNQNEESVLKGQSDSPPNESSEMKDQPQKNENHSKHDKIEIHFPGSEVVRSRFPKSFNVAETILTDWVKDGDFHDLPIENQSLQKMTSTSLQSAKKLEKKIMAHPITEKTIEKAFHYGLEAQSFFNKLKSQVGKDKK